MVLTRNVNRYFGYIPINGTERNGIEMAERKLRLLIAERLKTKRKERGYTSARAFAETAGITPAKYSEYEQGRVAIPLDMACLFCGILDCSLDELAGNRISPGAAGLGGDEGRLLEGYRVLKQDEKQAVSLIAERLSRP